VCPVYNTPKENTIGDDKDDHKYYEEKEQEQQERDYPSSNDTDEYYGTRGD
jgi:hypothetical protein